MILCPSVLAEDGSYTETSESVEWIDLNQEVKRQRSYSLSDISSTSENDFPFAVVFDMFGAIHEAAKERVGDCLK